LKEELLALVESSIDFFFFSFSFSFSFVFIVRKEDGNKLISAFSKPKKKERL